ncbi:MAG TPA: gamma-glutamyltransferase [Thermomicrobiales bacterium]|nr:gamma-glutamyltransferase [Thermomicrobiales bacterium]
MAERTTWIIDRTEAIARGGMVAAKQPAAATAGAEVLRKGGNAFDAAVTTAFAVGVAEPWMSGLGGGGYLIGLIPGQDPFVVEYPMVSPATATPAMFPLSGSGPDAALFGWPGVVDNANIVGYRSMAVPGVVAGLALTLERWGTISLADALAPAIRLAADGVPVTWHTTLKIAQDMTALRRFLASAAVFFDDDGAPLISLDQARPAMLRQPDLARTLETIAREGARAFYEGSIADALVRDLAANGAPFTRDDFARYEPSVAPTLTTDYAGHTIHAVGGGTGGTTIVESLNLMSALGAGAFPHNSADAIHRMTFAFRQAFADRFAYLADPRRVDVPLATLTDPAYAAERAAAFAPDRVVPIHPGDAGRLGVQHGLGASMQSYLDAAASGAQMADGSTTHLCVIDAAGNAVSLTQTLLSLFGSKVIVPGTGVLMNNGMMWFDPEPGRPNSIEGGKRPVANMAPIMVSRDGQAVASIGSSGGRKILNCHAQLLANLLDYGLSMQPAISAPRIDASTPSLLADSRIAPATLAGLRRRGHPVAVRDEDLLTIDFASPVGIRRDPDGTLRAGVDQYYFPATAVGADGGSRG